MFERAGQEELLRSVPLDGSSWARLASACARCRFRSSSRGPGTNPRQIRKNDPSSFNGRADKRIICEQRRSVEVCMIEQRCQLRDGGDAEASLDHAAGHHHHSESARRMNDSQRFAKAAAFGELEIHAIDGACKPWYVGRDKTRFIGNNWQLRA